MRRKVWREDMEWRQSEIKTGRIGDVMIIYREI